MEYEKLGSLVTIQKGRKNNIVDSYNGESKRIIQIQDLRNDENVIYTNDEKGVLVNENDILIAWDGANAGLVGYGKSGFLGSTLSMLRLKTTSVYSTYLGRFLNTKFEYFQKTATGATIPHLNRLALEELLIPLPSYADQIRIANVLGKIEDVIKARKNAIDQLDELVKATFYDMFGDPVKNEKGWEKKPLNYLGNLDRGVSKHRPRNAPELLGGKYPLVQTGDVTRAGLWLKKYQQTYSELGLKQSKMWPSGTLLITIAANIAQTSILTFDSCFPDSVVGFTPYEGKANTIFIHYLLSFYQESLEKNAPQSAQKNINLGVLRELESIVPDLILQNQFAIIAEKIEKLKEEQEKQLFDLEKLYTSVSHEAFSGDLNLSRIPYDESLLPEEKVKIDLSDIDTQLVIKPQEEVKIDLGDDDTALNITPDDEVYVKLPKSDFELSVVDRHEDWNDLSFSIIADIIKKKFKNHYFNAEMLLDCLQKEENINVAYYTSAEKKKRPELDNDEDFYGFIQSTLTGNNPFLELEQVFYDADKENISDISFRESDLDLLAKKDKKKRSGIYFHIKK